MPSASNQSKAPWRLDWARRYTRDQVAVEMSDVPRSSDPVVERAIDEAWGRELERAKREGTLLYDGRLGRLIQAEATTTGVRFRLGHTSFREFIGTHVAHMEGTAIVGAEHLANPLGISALPITTDGFIVLGRRGFGVRVHGGCLHPFGGMLEAADLRPDGSYDIFGSAARELGEELGLAGDEITELAIVGLIRDRALDQPELVFDASLRLSRSQLEAKFDGDFSDAEHTRIEFVPDDRASFVPFLADADLVTPVALGALLVHGRHRWGTLWFESITKSAIA